MMNIARILIVEDHPVVRNGLRVALLGRGYAVGEVGRAPDVLPYLREHGADLVLLDLSLPGGSGVDLLPGILSHRPRAPRVLVVSVYDDRFTQKLVQRNGAHGFVSKLAPMEQMLEAAAVVLRGEDSFSPVEEREVWSRLRSHVRLTIRQCEVIAAYVAGPGLKGAADRLGISIARVEEHLRRIRKILGVDSNVALVRVAVMEGFLSPFPEAEEVALNQVRRGEGQPE